MVRNQSGVSKSTSRNQIVFQYVCTIFNWQSFVGYRVLTSFIDLLHSVIEFIQASLTSRNGKSSRSILILDAFSAFFEHFLPFEYPCSWYARIAVNFVSKTKFDAESTLNENPDVKDSQQQLFLNYKTRGYA